MKPAPLTPESGSETLSERKHFGQYFATMPTLVIKSFPEELHAKLRQIAAAHRRSVTQETIYLLETAIGAEEKAAPAALATQSKWANRKLLPEYETLLNSGALTSDVDSTIGLSEERDAR